MSILKPEKKPKRLDKYECFEIPKTTLFYGITFIVAITIQIAIMGGLFS